MNVCQCCDFPAPLTHSGARFFAHEIDEVQTCSLSRLITRHLLEKIRVASHGDQVPPHNS